MLPKHLKGFAFRRLKNKVVLFLLLSLVLLFLGSYQSLSQNYEDKEKQGFKVLQVTLENLKNKVKKSEASLKLWNEKVKNLHADRTGLKIKQAKTLIEDLKKANSINNMAISFGNPELRPDFQDAKFSAIAYSNVTISYSSFNDIDSLRFINSLVHEIPGHAQVKSLTVNAVPNIDDTTLANIASGRFYDVVTVKIEMLWQDIVDKSAILQPNKPKVDSKAKPETNTKKGAKKIMSNSHILILFTYVCFAGYAVAIIQDNDIPYEDNDNYYVNIKKQIDNEPEYNIIEKVNVREINIPACADVPLAFDQCLQSICYESSPFGKIFRKIRGENKNNQCEYIERTPALGGRDCLFPKEEAVPFGNALNTYYQFILGLAKSITDEEVKKATGFIDSKCTIVKDSLLNKVVSINTPVDRNGVDPELTVPPEQLARMDGTYSPPNEPPKQTQKNTPKNETPSAPEIVIAEGVNNTSSMFTKDEINKINNVLRGFDKGKQEALGVLESGGIGFFLDSIIFYEPDQWTVWINGKKFINQENPSPDLNILKVSNNYVQLLWSTRDLDKQVPNWKRRLVLVKDNLYANNDNTIQVEASGEEKALVRFILKPNQTMNISTMSIIEGNKG